MALMVLRREELEVLSLLSRVKINSFSVFKGMGGFDEETLRGKRKEHASAIKDFAKDGAIWKDDDGKLRLIRELQAVFKVLNAPDKTIRIKSSSNAAIKEHYYCKVGEIGVLFSVGKQGDFYTVGYPFKDRLLSTWFKDEIIGDLGVGEGEKEEKSLEFRLSRDEFEIFMLIMIVQKGTGGSGGVSLDGILSGELIEKAKAGNLLKLNFEGYRDSYSEEAVRAALKSLEEKELLENIGGSIKSRTDIYEMLSPRNIRDVVEISEISPFMRGKNLYITNVGYMLVEPVISKQAEWKIEVEGLKTPPYSLIQKAMKFSYVKPSEKLKEALRKHM